MAVSPLVKIAKSTMLDGKLLKLSTHWEADSKQSRWMYSRLRLGKSAINSNNAGQCR